MTLAAMPDGSNPDTGLPGLASLLSTIHGIYPQARVTSGYRGPDNPLTIRNPYSMHAMGSMSDPRAVDVAPIPGVNFNDYVSSVKQAGVPIAQAYDEASHPFPWTTGPNWHLASGNASPPPQANPPQPYYNPPSGGQPPMPPRTPPMSLGAMMGQQQPVNLGDPAPVNTDAMGTSSLVPQGNSLGAMAQGLPGMPQHKPSKFTAGNIMGVLGDALSAYGGRAPTFGPMLQQEQLMSKQEDFEREKFNNELQLKLYIMRNGGMETDLGKKLMASGIMPGTPQWTQAMSTASSNELDPIVITPQGPMLRSQITGAATAGAPAPSGVTFTPIGG